MSLTLFETFSQIDPYVRFNDGVHVISAGEIRTMADPADLTEYAIGSDGSGRLVVYRLNLRGAAVLPPAYIEEKDRERRTLTDSVANRADFAAGFHGFL